jgi:hypothetical protein
VSLADATLGVMRTASLAVCTIGQGLALARGGQTKHAIKQVDRLLSNDAVEVDAIQACWVPHVVGASTSINVAMDWTYFDADGHATLMLALLTPQGLATPLLWLTVEQATLKGRQSGYEQQLLVRLAELLPAEMRVRIIADRGFASQQLYALLSDQLKFDYVIRMRGNITVTDSTGQTRPAAGWVGSGGRARLLRGARVTCTRALVGSVVCVQDKAMKEPWCLVTNSTDASPRALIELYGRRWAIECGFRDTKDLRFGMGMAAARVKTPNRRDRLWLLNAFAVTLLTLLGTAGEAIGYDRHLKSNTAKRRTHSLFRQGCMLYELIPNMPEQRLTPLIQQFAKTILQSNLFSCMLKPNAK